MSVLDLQDFIDSTPYKGLLAVVHERPGVWKLERIGSKLRFNNRRKSHGSLYVKILSKTMQAIVEGNKP